MERARTFDELLEVGGAEGRDGDGGLRPERRFAFVVSVAVALEIPQARGEHERGSHHAADADERKGGEGGGGFGFGLGTAGRGDGGKKSGGNFEMESGRRQIS